MKDLGTRPDMEQNIQWMFVLLRPKRSVERIVGVQRTEQSVGISKERTQQKEGAKVKQIVIYKSRTGFTKKYAKWLAQSLNCECIPQEDVGGERLSDYDVIIFGSSFRAGNVEELKWYKETILPFEKTNVLFVTGAMPPSSADAVKSIEQQLGKGEDREVKVFYLQSGLNYEAMNLGDKLMMKVFCKMMKSRKAHSEEEKALFEQMQKSFDVCEKANLEPMLNYIQGL